MENVIDMEKLINLAGLSTFKEQIKNKIGITYDDSKKCINLTFGNEVIDFMDASVFLVDGMLESVDVVSQDDHGTLGTFLKFAFNTGGGSKVIYVNVDDMLKDIPAKIAKLEEEMHKKVDKIQGMGLSTCDFTQQYKDMLDNVATTSDIIALFA